MVPKRHLVQRLWFAALLLPALSLLLSLAVLLLTALLLLLLCFLLFTLIEKLPGRDAKTQ